MVGALEVLSDGWIFSQSGPWDTKALVGAAATRGFDLREEQLGVFYRAGLLTPVVAIHDKAVSLPLTQTAFPLKHGNSTLRQVLTQAALEGKLSDPAVDLLPSGWSFGPSHRIDDERWWNGLLYSPWHILELANLSRFFTKDGRPVLEALAEMPNSDWATAWGARDRQTTLLLTAVEPRYLPELDEGYLRLVNADFEEWDEYRNCHTAANLADRLGTNAEMVTKVAENLLVQAHFHDPLGRWHRVVRHGSPRAQDDLRGEPRLALDLRRGAELLLLFAQELGAPSRDLSVPRRGWRPLDDRLSRHGESLDEALMDAGISPHPRVLLILEGETEACLAKRILDHLGLPLRDDELRIVVMRGVGQKERVLKLAAEAATPAILERAPDYYVLRRPACRIIVATDPEGPMSTPAKFRADLTREISKGLAEQGAFDVDPAEFDELIKVTTWDSAFEFSHFTDDEIASAMEALPDRAVPRGGSHLDVVAFVASARQQGRSLTKNNKKLLQDPPCGGIMAEHVPED